MAEAIEVNSSLKFLKLGKLNRQDSLNTFVDALESNFSITR